MAGIRKMGSGVIAFGLVSVPFEIYNAADSSSKISFNNIHLDCGSKIKQKQTCPECAVEVSEALGNLGKGYEVSKGNLLRFTKEEIKSLDEVGDGTIEITEFVDPEEIPPAAYSSLYYVGAGKGGDKAYKLLREAMRETGLVGVGTHATRGRTHIVVLHVVGNTITMRNLYYADEIRSIDAVPVPDGGVSENELKLAMKLVEMKRGEFDHEQFKDVVRARMQEMINARAEGQAIPVPAAPKEEKVLDLVAALQASLEAAEPAVEAKPAKAAKKAAKRKTA